MKIIYKRKDIRKIESLTIDPVQYTMIHSLHNKNSLEGVTMEGVIKRKSETKRPLISAPPPSLGTLNPTLWGPVEKNLAVERSCLMVKFTQFRFTMFC